VMSVRITGVNDVIHSSSLSLW